jgi:cell division protein FtsB
LNKLGSARADSLRPVLGGVVVLFMILLGAAGLKSWRDLSAAQAREKQLESRIETARDGIDHLRGRIERLRSDPAMLERLAREDLGLVEARDVVIELPRPDPGAASQADALPLTAAQLSTPPAPPPPAAGGAAAVSPRGAGAPPHGEVAPAHVALPAGALAPLAPGSPSASSASSVRPPGVP